MKDGTAVNAASVTVAADGGLVQKIAGGAAERRYDFADIARLDFPEPPEIAETAALVAAGKPAQALYKIEPVYRRFALFTKTPGSWWTEAAVLRLRALLLPPDLKVDPKAALETPVRIRAAARELMTTATDPDAIGEGQLALAELDIRAGQPELATAMLDEIVRDAPSGSGIKVRAWLLRGDLALKRQAFEDALECYLRIPALFGTWDELMPAALLGSARAYKGYGDPDRAERAYLDLIDTYPNSPQATAAKAESGL
jgi:tetratricopeptide (TPR) repeat protein